METSQTAEDAARPDIGHPDIGHPDIGRPIKPAGYTRWIVCFILFAAVVLSYIDRLVISVLKPQLAAQYHWTETGYADVALYFQLVYGIGFLVAGRIIDRIGAKMGYTLAMILWTAGHMLHAAVTTTTGMIFARLPLALGEAATYPAALVAVNDWFPKRERALAIGILNAGANVGAVVTPLIVPAIMLAFGWRMCFIITGALSFVWLAAWLLFYRKPRQHRMASSAEVAWIESDPYVRETRKAPYSKILKTPQAWAYMAGRFLIDPVWWTFLFWLPSFFAKQFGVKDMGFGPPLVAIYVLADLGSIFGGWLSGRRDAPADRPAVQKTLDAMREIAPNYGDATPTQLAVAWLLAHPAKIIPLVGSNNPEHIREAAGAADIQLSRQDWYKLWVAARGARVP